MGYKITIRASDVVPGPTAAPTLTLPDSPTAALGPYSLTVQSLPGASIRVYDGNTLAAMGVADEAGVVVLTVNLTEGTHELSVTARDIGKLESSRATGMFVVDRTAPVVTLTVQSPSASMTVSLDVSAPDGVQYIVSQDPTTPALNDPRWGSAPSSLTMVSPGGTTPTPVFTIPDSIPSGSAFELAGEVPQVPWVIHAWARDGAGNVGHTQAQVIIAIPVTDLPVFGELPILPSGEGGWLTGAVPQTPGETVDADEPYLIIETEGSTFAPLLQVDDGAEVEWLWGDGTIGVGAMPEKTFAGAGHRVHRLRVTPWSALRMLNVGYDAGDGGSESIPLRPAQQVSAIRRLQVAQGLEVIAFSGNPVAALDAHGLPNLHTIESFMNHSMKAVDVTECPALSRLCLEENECEGVLDLRGSPLIADIRGSVNSFSEILLPETVPELWHVCVQAVPGLAQLPYERFTNVIQLWIDRSGQTGVLPIVNPGMLSVLIWECGFTGVDLSLVSTNGALHQFNAANCGWSQAMVDYVLTEMVRINAQYGQREVILNGNSAPSATGTAAANTLRSAGWTVVTD